MLVIVGILGAVGMMGVAAFLDGFVTGRATAELTQKAQNALQRLVMEVRFAQAGVASGRPLLTVSADLTGVSFPSKRDGAVYAVTLAGTELRLNGRTLADRVSSFQVLYTPTTGEVRLLLGMERIGLFETTVYP